MKLFNLALWMFLVLSLGAVQVFSPQASTIAALPECKEPYQWWRYSHPTLALTIEYPCNLRPATFPDAVIFKDHFNRKEAPRDFMVLTTNIFPEHWGYGCGAHCFNNLMETASGSDVTITGENDRYRKVGETRIGGARASRIQFIEVADKPGEPTLYIESLLVEARGGTRWSMSCVALSEAQLSERTKTCNGMARTIKF